jgi:hypothetical protein
MRDSNIDWFREQMIKGNVKIVKDWLSENYNCGVDKTVIRAMLTDFEASDIYALFSQKVLYLLEPDDYENKMDFHNSLAKCIAKTLKEKYSLMNYQEAIKGSDLFGEGKIPKELKFIKNADVFFLGLWECLKNLGFDDERIGIAWMVVLKVVRELY